jgi:hypothetical protein
LELAGPIMLLIVIAAVSAVALYSLASGVRVPTGLARAKLGSMREQWLAEYRASQAS